MNTSIRSYTWLALGILFMFSHHAYSQDPWEWALQGSGGNHLTEMLTTDKFNNAYFAIYYHDSLHFNEESYYKELYQQDAYNALLVKVNEKGEIMGMLNFYTMTYGNMYPMKLVSDSSGHLFVAGSFRTRVFVGDTVINHLPVPWYDSEEAYLIKLDNSLDLMWAKVIGSNQYIDFTSLQVFDGKLLYIVDKSYSSSEEEYLYCFGQDTIHCNKQIHQQFFFFLDGSGNILDYNIIQGESFWFATLFKSPSGNLYLSGKIYGSLSLNDSTILTLNPVSNDSLFVLQLKPPFDVQNVIAIRTNASFGIRFFAANDEGELYFSVKSNDDITINDSVIPVQYYFTRIIGKLNQNMEVTWWESFVGIDASPAREISLSVFNDTLYAAFSVTSYLYLKDTIIHYSDSRAENHIFRYGPDGQRDQYLQTETNGKGYSSYLGFDNCGNLILSGLFQGKMTFGEDTLVSSSFINDQYDLFIAFYNKAKLEFDLGNQVTACGQVTLYGPPGWDHYLWEPGGESQKDLVVGNTGQFKLTAWNDECCRRVDSVSVTIQEPPFIQFDADSLEIKKSHSILLSAPAGNYSYLWSTGDTTSNLLITGSGLPEGYSTLWCRIDDTHCLNSDTIVLKMINDIGIEEDHADLFRIFPNPFTTSFIVTANESLKNVELFDNYGARVDCSIRISGNRAWVAPALLQDRWEILRVTTPTRVISRKVLQLD